MYEQLGEEGSKPVLMFSAITQASIGFITYNGSLLGALADLVEENNEQQSYFYRPRLVHLVQHDGPSNPPEFEDYHNTYDMAGAVLSGIAIGGVPTGEVGWYLGGPLGGVFGFIIGGTVGGTIGYGLYNGGREEDYEEALEDWCRDQSNGSHPDFDAICEGVTEDDTDL